MTETYTYDAFGTLNYVQSMNENGVLEATETAISHFLYTGEQYDSITKLYYLRARRYDTTAGRFTQEDTYLGDGRNLYAYVGNNPLKYVDPSGHGKNTNNFGSALLEQLQSTMFGLSGDYFSQTGMVMGLVMPYAVSEAEPIDMIQSGLDILGLIPGYGEPADFINGVIYTCRGDAFNAAMSFVAVLPVAGMFATGAKATKKVTTKIVAIPIQVQIEIQ